MGWRPAAFRRAFLAAAIGWAIALPFATFVASRPHVSSGPYLFALSVYLTGRTICHQLAGRSFQLWGHQMPVCARCSGIYLGGAVAALIAPFRTTSVVSYGSPALGILLCAALPTLATLVFEWTTGIAPSNAIRSLAGVPIGAAAAWLVVRVLR